MQIDVAQALALRFELRQLRVSVAARQVRRDRALRFQLPALGQVVLQRRIRADVFRMQARQRVPRIFAFDRRLQGAQITGFLRQHFDFHAARRFLLRMQGQRVRVGQGEGKQRRLLPRAQGGQLRLHLRQARGDGRLRGVLQGVDSGRGGSGQTGAMLIGAVGGQPERGDGLAAGAVGAPFGQQQASGQQDDDEQRELQRVAQQESQDGRQQLAQGGAALVRRAIGVGTAFLVLLAAAAVARVVAARFG